MNKKFWLAGLGLAFMYAVWLSASGWNLGFTMINSLFLVLTAVYFGEIKKNNFLKAMWVLSLLLGIMMAVRSNETVKGLTILTIIILNVMVAAMTKVAEVKLDVGKVILTQFSMVGGFFGAWREVIGAMSWQRETKREKLIKKIVIGVVLAIPLLLVFGSLFYSADPIFARLIGQIRWPKILINAQLMWRIITSGIFFGAVLATWRIKVSQTETSLKLKKWTEVNIAVAILEVLIAVFCVIQIRYLGSGPEEFRRLGIVFSEYTRNGYNQMILASILAYGIITMLRISGFLTWSMLAEILVLIASATKRNYVYQSVYGFTEVRLMGFFLSGWLVAMVALMGYKILKKKNDDWQTRAIVLLSATTILMLNVFDVDGTIVKTKPASLDWGIDYQYMAGLSDDGYAGHEKVLTEVESQLKNNQVGNMQQKDDVRYLIDSLKWNYERDQEMSQNSWNGWGNWNYSTAKSLQYFDQNQGRLKKVEDQIDSIELQLKEKGSAAAKKDIENRVGEMMVQVKKFDPKATVKETKINNFDYSVGLTMEIMTNDIEKAKLLVPSLCSIKTNTESWMIIDCEEGIK